MERIYSEKRNGRLAKASPETVAFLLGFSKSLYVIKHAGMALEANLN